MRPFGWHPPYLVDNRETLSGKLGFTGDSVGI